MSEKYYNDANGSDINANESKKGGINAGLIILLLGMVTTTTGIIMCKNTDMNKYFKTKEYNTSVAADKVANINIESKFGDYTIKKGSGKEITIDAKGVAEDFTAELKGDTLNITSEKKAANFWISFPMLTYQSCKVEIVLPEKQYDSLIINDGTGDLNLESLKIKEIVSKNGTGDKEFNNITCDTLNVTNGTGDSKIEDLTCVSCKFSSGTGDVDFDNINCKEEIEVELGTGDTTIENSVCSGFNAEHGTGDFTFSGTVNGDIKIKSGVGDLEVNLTNPETDFGKNGKYKMSIEKGVGDKEITYNN